MLKLLITAPPMARNIALFEDDLRARGFEPHCPQVAQQLTEDELINLVPQFHVWIIGDDPVTERVLTAARAGLLTHAVRWGIGMDNVDREAAARLGYDIRNTPNVFGTDVAEVAVGYCLALARKTFEIDRAVRAGGWPKPTGRTLAGKSIAILGFGDIGRETAWRLHALGGKVETIYDPSFRPDHRLPVQNPTPWPDQLDTIDYLILTAPLNKATRHIINAESLRRMKPGACLVNISRGGLVDESALHEALKSGHLAGAALEVMEQEPLPAASSLRQLDTVIFGCHNASNTEEGIRRATAKAIELLMLNPSE
jgi:D-3-phosphoglycerate dehydrogenase